MNLSLGYRRWWEAAIGLTDAMYGIAYLLGGAAQTPALLIMGSVLPMRVWGGLLMAVGVLMAARLYVGAGVLGALVWSMFTITSAMTLVMGTSPAAGGVFLVAGFTLLHLLVAYGAMAAR